MVYSKIPFLSSIAVAERLTLFPFYLAFALQLINRASSYLYTMEIKVWKLFERQIVYAIGARIAGGHQFLPLLYFVRIKDAHVRTSELNQEQLS